MLTAQFSCSVMSYSLQPHESQHARPPCPSPNPGVHSDSCPLSRWCHPAISSSVVPFSSCPQSLSASESFPMSQLLTWGGQSTGVSALASFLPKKSQGWFPSEWTGWISLQSKGLMIKKLSINHTNKSQIYTCSKCHRYLIQGFSKMVSAEKVGKWVGRETLFAGSVCNSEMLDLWQRIKSFILSLFCQTRPY